MYYMHYIFVYVIHIYNFNIYSIYNEYTCIHKQTCTYKFNEFCAEKKTFILCIETAAAVMVMG